MWVLQRLASTVAILELDPTKEPTEESLLVAASGIIEELGYELLLMVPRLVCEVEIRVVAIKCVRLRPAVRVLLLRSSLYA